MCSIYLQRQSYRIKSDIMQSMNYCGIWYSQALAMPTGIVNNNPVVSCTYWRSLKINFFIKMQYRLVTTVNGKYAYGDQCGKILNDIFNMKHESVLCNWNIINASALLVPHICVGDQGHHWSLDTKPNMNQCWFIVNWNLMNKRQWSLHRNTKVFIHEIHLEVPFANWWSLCPGEMS